MCIWAFCEQRGHHQSFSGELMHYQRQRHDLCWDNAFPGCPLLYLLDLECHCLWNSLPNFCQLKQHSSLLLRIRWMQPTIVSRYKICNHLWGTFTLCIWFHCLILVNPTWQLMIICIECQLIMEPHHCTVFTGWRHWLVHLWKILGFGIDVWPWWEEYILMVINYIFTLVSIIKLAFGVSLPAIIKFLHPSLGCHEMNLFGESCLLPHFWADKKIN